MLPPCRIMASLNQKLKLSSGHFGFFLTLNQKGKKGDNVLAKMIDTNYQEELKAATAHAGRYRGLYLNRGDSPSASQTAMPNSKC